MGNIICLQSGKKFFAPLSVFDGGDVRPPLLSVWLSNRGIESRIIFFISSFFLNYLMQSAHQSLKFYLALWTLWEKSAEDEMLIELVSWSGTEPRDPSPRVWRRRRRSEGFIIARRSHLTEVHQSEFTGSDIETCELLFFMHKRYASCHKCLGKTCSLRS